MNLVWKLLRRHISLPQFVGFFFANLFGMFIVLFGFQFYRDVLPVFTAEDSFMKADYLIMSKKVGTGNTISGRSNSFSGSEVDEVANQPFVKKVGKFTSTEYKVDASMGVAGTNVLNSELFFESVPDEFVERLEIPAGRRGSAYHPPTHLHQYVQLRFRSKSLIAQDLRRISRHDRFSYIHTR